MNEEFGQMIHGEFPLDSMEKERREIEESLMRKKTAEFEAELKRRQAEMSGRSGLWEEEQREGLQEELKRRYEEDFYRSKRYYEKSYSLPETMHRSDLEHAAKIINKDPFSSEFLCEIKKQEYDSIQEELEML